MSFESLMEEGRERRRQRLERQRIATENMSPGCVLLFIIPLVLMFILNAIGGVLVSRTEKLAYLSLNLIGLALFCVALCVLCARYKNIDKPRPGQIITGPDGRPVRFGVPPRPHPQQPVPTASSHHHQPPSHPHHLYSHHQRPEHTQHQNHPQNQLRHPSHPSHHGHPSRNLLLEIQPPRPHSPGRVDRENQPHQPGRTTVGETPPPSYSQVMGRPPNYPASIAYASNRTEPDSRLIEYGNF